jgi:DNA-binding response OmpR family regulator
MISKTCRHKWHANSIIAAPLSESTQLMPHILITDDDPELRTISRFFLERKGLQVSEAENGLQAVEMISNSDYDAVVLDLLMPIQDGFTTLGEIRKLERGKHIPVIVLSSLAQEANVLRALQLGASDFVRKPYSPDELYMRLKRLVPALLNAPN